MSWRASRSCQRAWSASKPVPRRTIGRVSSRRSDTPCGRMWLGHRPLGECKNVIRSKAMPNAARRLRWDTRNKRPNDPMERFTVPLLCKSLIGLSSCTPLGTATPEESALIRKRLFSPNCPTFYLGGTEFVRGLNFIIIIAASASPALLCSARAAPDLLEGYRAYTPKSIMISNGFGGESGIRTHVTVSRKHAFQACAFSHSATPPYCQLIGTSCRGGRAFSSRYCLGNLKSSIRLQCPSEISRRLSTAGV